MGAVGVHDGRTVLLRWEAAQRDRAALPCQASGTFASWRSGGTRHAFDEAFRSIPATFMAVFPSRGRSAPSKDHAMSSTPRRALLGFVLGLPIAAPALAQEARRAPARGQAQGAARQQQQRQAPARPPQPSATPPRGRRGFQGGTNDGQSI
jgi:hypothetical protein